VVEVDFALKERDPRPLRKRSNARVPQHDARLQRARRRTDEEQRAVHCEELCALSQY